MRYFAMYIPYGITLKKSSEDLLIVYFMNIDKLLFLKI